MVKNLFLNGMRPSLTKTILFFLLVGCNTNQEHASDSSELTPHTMKTIIHSSEAPAPIGPYSQAVMHGNTLYVSGQIAINSETGELDTSSITNETELVMKNMGAVLAAAGMGFEHVLKCSIFLSDMGNFGQVNDVYGRYFSSNPPARETVAVKMLPKNVNVEISCIAAK